MIRTLTDQRLVRPATGDDIEIYSKRQNDTWFNRQNAKKQPWVRNGSLPCHTY